MQTLIAEDVLLLLLDDETGKPSTFAQQSTALAGAALAELALDGRVRFEESTSAWTEGKVHAEGAEPPADPILADAFAIVAEKTRSPSDVLHRVAAKIEEPLRDRLVERGILERREKKVLGLFPSTSWPAADATHETEVRSALERVVVGGADPDPSSAVILSILSAAGVAGEVLTYPDVPKKAVEERAKAVAVAGTGTDAVRSAVDAATQAAMIAIWTAVGATMTATIINTTNG